MGWLNSLALCVSLLICVGFIGGGNRRATAVAISAGSWTVGTADAETQSVTVAAGSDRLFVVAIGCQGTATPDDCTPSATPTLNATVATTTECDPAVTTFSESGGLREMVHLYCWKDADIAAACATSCTLDINIPATANTRRVAYALWTGVDQTDSIGITCSNSSTAATNITCTLTGATAGNNNIASCIKNSNDVPPTFTWASGFTEQTDHQDSTGWGISSEAHETDGGADTADCTNTADGSTRIAVIAMEVND